MASVNTKEDHQNIPHQSVWISRKVTKTRSTPRPVSMTGNCRATRQMREDIHNNPTLSPPKPQSWSESNNSETQLVSRMRIRDKLRPVSAAMAARLRQQREKRRTKKRGPPYMPSNEGTSTGEEDGELFQMDNVRTSDLNSIDNTKSRHRYSLHQHGENSTKQPPPTVTAVSRRFSSPASRRMSKSPSDLEADDEDNQDYDSASMVSASELMQSRVKLVQNSAYDDDAVFNAQFQEIRMAGMQQLAEIDSNGTGLIDSPSSSVEEQVGKILDQERREKSVLIQELGQKEQRIYEMEKMVLELNRRLLDTGLENEHLRAENRALLQAVSKLSTAE